MFLNRLFIKYHFWRVRKLTEEKLYCEAHDRAYAREYYPIYSGKIAKLSFKIDFHLKKLNELKNQGK
jgi:hypothetical protein